MATKEKRVVMSDAHKKALAKGREEGLLIRRYLEALDATHPRRGRRRTSDSMERRLKAVAEFLKSEESPLTRLHLIQEQLDLENELAASDDAIEIGSFEEDFVKVARSYGERKGITYSAWRAIGISAPVLARAGIPRTRS